MSILLTREELNKLWIEYEAKDPLQQTLWDRVVTKAQLKKVVEWGTDICGDHSRKYTVSRFECSKCMEALLKEIKDG